jgi:hypothetical protein
MAIAYTTSDKKKFDTLAEAEAHEATLAMLPTIEAFLDAQGIVAGKGSRRNASASLIMAWEAARHGFMVQAEDVAEDAAE